MVEAARRWRAFLALETEATGLPVRWILVAGLIAYSVVGLVAVNPIHLDEHFQVLEFAHARSGAAPIADLPWEHSARIRSTVQPVLAMAGLSVMQALGVDDPFIWALVLRWMSGLIAVGAGLFVIAHVGPRLGREARGLLWVTTLLLWFAPWVQGRFSAENWASMALAAGVVFWLRATESNRLRDAVAAGGYLAVSFLFRYQMAFALLAVCAWSLMRRDSGGRRVLVRAMPAGALVVSAGLVLDAWFYGSWAITPWLYFRANLIEGVAATFGTSPWYAYGVWPVLGMVPPLGLAVAGGVVAGVLARPRSLWSWILVAFVVGHSAVGHKELRFLLPMVPVVPVLLAHALDRWPTVLRTGWGRGGLLLLAVQNLLLLGLTLTPLPHRGQEMDTHFFQFVWDRAEERPVTLVYPRADPLQVWDLPLNLYRHPDVNSVAWTGEGVPDPLEAGWSGDVLLVLTDPEEAVPAGLSAGDLLYAAEPGYGPLLRTVGLVDSGWARRLDGLTGWLTPRVARRVFRIDRDVP